MTALHPFRVADASATSKLDPITLEAIVKGTLFVIGVSDTMGDITQSVGQIALAVAWAKTGLIYFYDSTDTTTADDGATCLVDASGHRYKLQDSATAIKVASVLAQQNTPPVSPSVGDAYVVGTSPTGAWSAYANDVALYTRRGWIYGVPKTGLILLNAAMGLNIQYSASGSWGAMGVTFADGSIRERAFEFPLTGQPVESTLNTPPGSPTVGLYYIVGASPTGAWSGQSGKVATYYNSAWEFIAPYTGATVFDRALGYDLTYQSGAWSGLTTSSVQTFTASGTWTKPALGTMALIECWGAGGSGGRGSNNSGGGGGGSYSFCYLPLSSLGSTETVTVGAGGASVTSGSNASGFAGTDTTFGAWLKAYAGGGGMGSSAGAQAGGGGAGVGGDGTTAMASTGGPGGITGSGQAGGAAGSPSEFGGGGGATGSTDGGASYRGGGGGAAGTTGVGHVGGASVFGGGGGGSPIGAGGASQFGGAGGAGANGTSATAGSQPGGGGGAAVAGNSGKGGNGKVRITVF